MIIRFCSLKVKIKCCAVKFCRNHLKMLKNKWRRMMKKEAIFVPISLLGSPIFLQTSYSILESSKSSMNILD